MTPLLEVKNLKKHFPIKKGLLQREVASVKALDGVSFQVFPGETIGLVGESGCGKSTLGRTITRLHEPSSGQILFKGEDFGQLKGQKLREQRANIQMIFQDPFASLDPRMTIYRILCEPFKVHQRYTESERLEKIERIIDIVGLKKSALNRYPHEFSGGQRQRISIARAMLINPKLVMADEPVSALDVSIQAQILNLLNDLQKEFKLTYLFISHDLSVIEHQCDRIAVMYLGKIVEMAPRDELFQSPKHPYTKALIRAIPEVGRGKQTQKRSLFGEVPSPMNPPNGCHFHPRCPEVFSACDKNYPELMEVSEGQKCACFLYHNQTQPQDQL